MSAREDNVRGYCVHAEQQSGAGRRAHRTGGRPDPPYLVAEHGLVRVMGRNCSQLQRRHPVGTLLCGWLTVLAGRPYRRA